MVLFEHRNLAARFAAARKEICDGYLQYLGNEVEPAACHTTCAIFISSHLFSGDPNFSSKAGLGERQLQPTQPKALSNYHVDRVRH